MKTTGLQNAATGILVGCAVVVTALAVRREFGTPATEHSEIQVVENRRPWESEGHRIGSAGAPVTIVTFSDFQCPACRTLASSLETIQSEYPKQISVVYRHFPLAVHAMALPAVRASECAADHGGFEPFHDAVYQNQDSLGIWSWNHFARVAGVRDLSGFEDCVRASQPIAALERDTIAGQQLGVTGTPTILINGERFNGAPPLATLRNIVRRELADAEHSGVTKW